MVGFYPAAAEHLAVQIENSGLTGSNGLLGLVEADLEALIRIPGKGG